MSKRRMFSSNIIESDVFLDMPLSTQALYMHLSMNADDYGFVSPKRIMRMIGANDDDLKVLIMKRFVLGFDSGVIVIKHWQINNTVRKDRSHDTTYKEEFKTLTFNEFGAYTELKNMAKTADEIASIDSTLKMPVVNNNETPVEKPTTKRPKSKVLATKRRQNGNQMTTEIRLDKIRLDKTSTNVLVSDVPPQDEIGALYYQVIEVLHLPVRNHKTLKDKIKELETIKPREYVIRYLKFMRENYANWTYEFKPDVNEALEVHAKMKQIENALNRAKAESKPKQGKGFKAYA